MINKFILISHIQEQFPSNIVDAIPGKVNDRKTLLGELNWIFTAITDTIAWNTLPRDLFQKLFRQVLIADVISQNHIYSYRIYLYQVLCETFYLPIVLCVHTILDHYRVQRCHPPTLIHYGMHGTIR